MNEALGPQTEMPLSRNEAQEAVVNHITDVGSAMLQGEVMLDHEAEQFLARPGGAIESIRINDSQEDRQSRLVRGVDRMVSDLRDEDRGVNGLQFRDLVADGSESSQRTVEATIEWENSERQRKAAVAREAIAAEQAKL